MSKENTETTENTETVEDEPIEIRLDQDVYDSLLGIFVQSKLSKESLEVFNDYLATGVCAGDALHRAVINEMANIALADKLERMRFATAIKNNKEDNK